MLEKKLKEKIIEKYRTNPQDTGSAEVQIALLSEEMKQLSQHLKTHKKDNSSRRGLLRKVNQRRKLLKYLFRENPKSYEDIVVKLKIKKTALTAEEVLPEERGGVSSSDE